MRVAMAWSMLMGPLRLCVPRSANSIQPALNPSIICMRGVGFFMPWARKRFPLCARHDLSTHRCPQRFGECCGQSIRRDALWALKLDYTLAFPDLLQERRGGATDVVG